MVHSVPIDSWLRAHLGLQVPRSKGGQAGREEECRLHIGDGGQGSQGREEEGRGWQEGEWLLFDDSFQHDVTCAEGGGAARGAQGGTVTARPIDIIATAKT